MEASKSARPTDLSAVVLGTTEFAICNSLLLTLNDRDVLEAEIMGILEDGAAARHHAVTEDHRAELHAAAGALIDDILAAGNSGRRPLAAAPLVTCSGMFGPRLETGRP